MLQPLPGLCFRSGPSNQLPLRRSLQTRYREKNLAAGAKVLLRPALPFPLLLLPLPDRIHTPRNTSAISL